MLRPNRYFLPGSTARYDANFGIENSGLISHNQLLWNIFQVEIMDYLGSTRRVALKNRPPLMFSPNGGVSCMMTKRTRCASLQT